MDFSDSAAAQSQQHYRDLLFSVGTYTTTGLIERHGFQTPAAVRQDQLSPAALAA